MLFLLVSIYIFFTITIGIFAARKVKTSNDFAVAGRSLSLPVVIATVFATWFGAEAIFGVSSTFIDEGLTGVVADPFGASLCLVIAGVIFSKYLYKFNFSTLSTFYRKRYNRSIEVIITLIIILSYLGWVAAQITAIGLVLKVITNGLIGESLGMILGTIAVLSYTTLGGMVSVAIIDLVQMIVIIIGLIITVYFVVELSGGIIPVINLASMNGKLNFFPNGNIWLWLSFVGSLITMMLGSITQQDVYQRITSARTQKIALWGSLIGALLYFCFAFLPMFIAYSATIINPEFSANIDAHGSEIILPLFIMQYTPIFAQVIFFGAVISAIMSTSAATLLAPSVMFTENILSEYLPGLTDKKKLLIMRQSLIVFAIAVLIYAFNSELTIFGMVESAYKVTLVGAFTPLIFGIFWKKANDYGALLAIILGVFSWLSLELLFGDHFIVPPQLIGFAFSVFGMLVGSLVFKQDLSKKLIIHR